MIRTALVIAGGQGSRMALTRNDLPKPLVRVLGIPLIALVIRNLRRHGVSNIHVAVRHRAGEIESWVRQNLDSDEEPIQFLHEIEPLGTVGALAWLRVSDGPIVVVNSDLLSGIDLTALVLHHAECRADLTIATHWETIRLKLGEVAVNEAGAVTEYREKPIKRFRISSGTYVVGPRVLGLLGEPEWLPFPALVDLSLAAGLHVVAYEHGASWIDVNDEGDLRTAERLLAEDPVAFGLRPEELHDAIVRMGIES